MATFDFLVCGTGSGGGTICGQLVLRFPFSTIGALEAGQDWPTPDDRRADFTQSIIDDVLRRTVPYQAEAVVSTYGTDPSSPYYGSGFPFTTLPSEQGMGLGVGGSSMHNGMVCGRGRPEDYDEWDYLLVDGQNTTELIAGSAVQTAGKIPGSITWAGGGPGTVALVATAPAVTAVQTLLDTGRAVFIASSDNPKVSPPFRVISTAPLTINITTNMKLDGAVAVGTGIETVPSTGASVVNWFRTMWNRSRLLETYMEAEHDIDTDFDAGVTNPEGVSAAVHGVNGYQHIGRVGRRRSDTSLIGGNPARPWIDQRPYGPANTNVLPTPRQSTTGLAMMASTTESTLAASGYPAPSDGIGGSTFPYLPDANNWSSVRPSGVSFPTPWGRTFQMPLNLVGFGPGDEPVAGGHGITMNTRWDKYDERRGTLLTSIDPVRNYRIQSVSIAVEPVVGAGELTAGATLTSASGASGTVKTAEARTETFYTAAMAFTAASVGDILVSVPPGKQGTVIETPSVVLDSGFTPYVKIVLTLDASTVPFGAGDAFDRTVSLGGGSVSSTFYSPAGVPMSPTCSQRVQVDMTSGEYLNAEAITLPSVGATTSAAPIPSLTIVTGAIVDKLKWAGSSYIDVLASSVAVGTPAVNDPVVGSLSGASGTIVKVTMLEGVTTRAYLRIKVGPKSTSFMQGEPIQEAAAAWTAVAFRINPVMQVAGVEYIQKDSTGALQRYTGVSSNVVLSMGAFGTPACLQRSGVGGMDRLGPPGVDQVVDLPGVGDRCVTHAFTFTAMFAMTAPQPADALSYFLQFAGAFRSSNDRSGLGYEVGSNNPSGALLFDEDFDIALGAIGLGLGAYGEITPVFFGGGGYGLSAKRLFAGAAMQAELGPGFYFNNNLIAGLDVLCIKPRSRGDGVRITSTSPFDLPKIDHGLMSEWRSKDAEATLEAADHQYTKVADGGVAGGFAATLMAFPIQTPPIGTGTTPDRVNAIVGSAGAAYHAVGTCAMGPLTDSKSVLDERARLRHVLGVRVADNSPYPTHVRINPHGPTLALAHNIASMIEEDGGC